jgi:hypothetical protein
MEPNDPKLALGGNKYLSATIFRVREGDDDSVYVEGCLAAEEVDDTGEVMDWSSSVPHFKAWNKSQAEKTANAEGGVSVGNLRAMHQRIVAGKFVAMEYDEVNRKVLVTAKVTAPEEQRNVREGIYTAFSIGAKYMKKWYDSTLKAVRWTAKPFEGSLVDIGAMPSANGFTYRTIDGTEETRAFDGGRHALREAFEAAGKRLAVAEENRLVERVSKMASAEKGLWTVSSFAQLIASLVSVRDSIAYEREQEGDLSPVTDRVSNCTEELLECLAAYTQEEVSEEISRSQKEATMDVSDITKGSKTTAAATAAAAAAVAAGGDAEATPEQIQAAEKTLKDAQGALDALKAKSKCMKSESECDSDSCPQHGDKVKSRKAKADADKNAAAGANGEVALKRADVIEIVRSTVGEELKPITEGLQAVADAVKAMGAQPVETNARTRVGNFTEVKKEKDGEAAEKSVGAMVKDGDTKGAIMRIRERPNFITQ